MDLFQALRNSYFTRGLSDNEVQSIVAVSEAIECPDMCEVVREFEKAVDLFVLVEGKARVTTGSGDPIARLKEGSIFGEIALFSKENRTASVISDGPSKFIRVVGMRLNALMDAEPAIGVKVLRNVGRTLCEHLRSSNIQLETVLNAL